MEQCNLNGANSSRRLHHIAKGSKSVEYGVKAVKIASNNKGSVVYHWARHGPSGHSQYKNDKVYDECGEVQNIPSITERKNVIKLNQITNEIIPAESTKDYLKITPRFNILQKYNPVQFVQQFFFTPCSLLANPSPEIFYFCPTCW